MASIQIINAHIVDGVNDFPAISNIYVVDGKIQKISNEKIKADRVIDIKGKTLTPGFFDSHIHLESTFATPLEFSKEAVLQGTLGVVADPHEIANVLGTEGIDMFLSLAKEALFDIYVAIPSCVPATPFDTNGAGVISAEDIKKYAELIEVVSLGEVMANIELIKGDREVEKKIKAFAGKRIDGHTAGLNLEQVRKYIQKGIDNDHEATSAETVEELIKSGATPFIREGSAAKNLVDIISRLENKSILNFCCFCTDDKHLGDIKKEGHINNSISLAMKLGADEKVAVRMASANGYHHYNIPNKGQIKVGYDADIVVSHDQYSKIDYVFRKGECIVSKGRLIEKRAKVKRTFENTVKVSNLKLTPELWKDKKLAIELIDNQILTKLSESSDGAYLAVCERHGKNGNVSCSYLANYGIQGGAIATTVAHDSHNIIVVGDKIEDMQLAVDRLVEIKGGYVLVRNWKVTAEIPLCICGVMSDESSKMIIKRVEKFTKETKKLKINTNVDPMLTLSFISLPVIPGVRLLDTGLFDVLKREYISEGENGKRWSSFSTDAFSITT